MEPRRHPAPFSRRGRGLLFGGAVALAIAMAADLLPWSPFREDSRGFALGASILLGVIGVGGLIALWLRPRPPRERLHRSILVPDMRAGIGPDRAGDPTGPGVSSARTPNPPHF